MPSHCPSGLPGMYSMARKWCSHTVKRSYTWGTPGIPSSLVRILNSRSSRTTASVLSRSSPACGRASFSTTSAPSALRVARYTPPPLEKCSERTTS